MASREAFIDAMTSDVFVFHCGGCEEVPTTATFSAHAALIAKWSEPLSALLSNGSTRESISKVVHLPEVLPETFADFLYWAYGASINANYISHTIVPNGSEAGGEPETYCARGGSTNHSAKDDSIVWSRFGDMQFCSNDCNKASAGKPNEYCTSCGYMYIQPSSSWICPHCKNRVVNYRNHRNHPWSADSSPPRTHVFDYVFFGRSSKEADSSRTQLEQLVSHARLYVFADMYLIEPLRKFCLDKLYKILSVLPATGREVAAITDLIACVYDNTAAEGDSGSSGVGIPLRTLTLQFAVAHKAKLIEVEDFVEFLGEGGEFVKDFVVEKVRPAI